MFYEKFLRLCQSKKTTPTKALKDMGLHPSLLRRWREGGEPRSATLRMMERYFQVPMFSLLSREEEETELTRLMSLCTDLDDSHVMLLTLLAKAFRDPEKVSEYLDAIK